MEWVTIPVGKHIRFGRVTKKTSCQSGANKVEVTFLDKKSKSKSKEGRVFVLPSSENAEKAEFEEHKLKQYEGVKPSIEFKVTNWECIKEFVKSSKTSQKH